MKLKATLDFSGVDRAFWKLEDALQNRILKKAAEDGGKVLYDAYIAEVPKAVDAAPPGTFVSGRGTAQEKIEHFQRLVDSIGLKVRMFQDKTGAYAIVGVVSAPGSHKPDAPQGQWGETGTDERSHKDDSPTGRMPAYHWLENAMKSLPKAQEMAIASLADGINRVIGN